MKKHEIIFWIIKVPFEIGIVILAFFFARNIRLITDLIPRVQLPIQTINNAHLLNFALAGAVLFVVIFSISGLYKMRIYQSKAQELLDVILASVYWFFIYIACLFLSIGFLYTVEIPRLVILFVLVIAVGLVSVERIILDVLQGYLLRKWVLSKRRILVFLRSNEEEILEELVGNDIYEVVGYIHQDPIADIRIPYIGWIDAALRLIRSGGLDELLFVHSDLAPQDMQEIFEFSRIYGLRYRYIANLFETEKMNTELSFFGKIPTIEIRSIGLTPWGRVTKRIFDIVSSCIALIFLAPLLAVVSIMIYLQDGHWPIYKSVRVGKGWTLFPMYKFRSMRVGADAEKQQLLGKNERQDGPLFKIENDPRITKFGRFIRHFDIDELPQLWNVLLGNMSLIGPRPHLGDEVRLYKEHQKRVLTLKPGITGMAQSNGRHKNSFDDEVRLDTFYIENWTLLLDIKILVKTAGVVLARKGR